MAGLRDVVQDLAARADVDAVVVLGPEGRLSDAVAMFHAPVEGDTAATAAGAPSPPMEPHQ